MKLVQTKLWYSKFISWQIYLKVSKAPTKPPKISKIVLKFPEIFIVLYTLWYFWYISLLSLGSRTHSHENCQQSFQICQFVRFWIYGLFLIFLILNLCIKRINIWGEDFHISFIKFPNFNKKWRNCKIVRWSHHSKMLLQKCYSSSHSLSTKYPQNNSKAS